jgi:hypothetical protein
MQVLRADVADELLDVFHVVVEMERAVFESENSENGR